MSRLADHPTAASGNALEPSGEAAVRVEGLTHRYPPPRVSRRRSAGASTPGALPAGPALDHVSFEIAPGEIFGILGPNGGGKTTLFKILSTMLKPSEGSVSVFGHDVLRQPDLVRQQLGVVFQMPSLDTMLTAQENLTHQGHLYGLHGADLRQRIDEALAGVNLADRATERVERFSGGMRRRVELAKALLHHPRLLLLDEPATGLDPGARRDMRVQLERLREQQGITIALTTHLMEEADHCDRLAILSRGKLVAVDTPANLKSRIGGDVITVEAEGNGDAIEEFSRQIAQRFGPWAEGSAPTVIDGRIRIEKENGPGFVATLATAFPGKVRSITVGRPTLEDVFMHMTGQRLWEGSEPPAE